MIRNQKQQHQVPLLSILSALISCLSLLLDALLLNAELAMATGMDSCSASTINGIPCSGKLSISFPFVTSDECHFNNSSFLISNCNRPAPEWPAFTRDATIDSPLNSSTTIINMFSPPLLSNPILSDNNFNYASGPYGYINLTWSAYDLLNQSNDICDKPASYEQISQYIPQSINLQDFAHSAFNLDSSNIILLFSCNATQAISSSDLTNSSSACTAYSKQCPSKQQNKSYNCYQYMNPGKELNLPQVMNGSGCKEAIFFVALSSSLPISTWKQGIIRLKWSSIGTDWVASNFKACETCLSKKGSCGYNASGDFQCYCNTSCPAENKPAASPSSIETDTACHGGLMHCNRIFQICLAVALSGVALTLAFLGFCRFGKLIRKKFSDLSLRRPLRRLQDSTDRPNLSVILTDLEGLMERPIAFSYSAIASATNSFSHVVGEGGFGVVYKGTLPSTNNEGHEGVHIAVKVLAIRSKHIKKQFLNEVTTIGRIHHVNVVRLLGFCVHEDQQMLVYEYVANGSLDRWLFGGKTGGVDEKQMLDWNQRYTTAVGVARGLSYLHEECRHRVVHCDIKPQNILLDEAMSPKIADFGVSRLMGKDESRVVTIARGTPGYMAPEFWRGGEGWVSTKIDVYSYGMLLLELISGQHNFTRGDANTDSLHCFPVMAFEAAMQGNIGDIVDSRLGLTMQASHVLEDEAQWHQIWTATFVALWCIQDHPASRPSMREVVQYLDGKVSVSRNPPQPSMFVIPSRAQTSHDRQQFTPISMVRS